LHSSVSFQATNYYSSTSASTFFLGGIFVLFGETIWKCLFMFFKEINFFSHLLYLIYLFYENFQEASLSLISSASKAASQMIEWSFPS